jgi:hypothetical protein
MKEHELSRSSTTTSHTSGSQHAIVPGVPSSSARLHMHGVNRSDGAAQWHRHNRVIIGERVIALGSPEHQAIRRILHPGDSTPRR